MNISGGSGRWYRLMAVLVLVVAGLGGCGQSGELTAAPLGRVGVLEDLAESYTKVSDQHFSVSPMSLPGDERKRFLNLVFADSGYSYTETLHALAQGMDTNNQHHKDMAELLLLPHRNPRYPMDPAEIYSVEELKDVAVVERLLNQ